MCAQLSGYRCNRDPRQLDPSRLRGMDGSNVPSGLKSSSDYRAGAELCTVVLGSSSPRFPKAACQGSQDQSHLLSPA